MVNIYKERAEFLLQLDKERLQLINDFKKENSELERSLKEKTNENIELLIALEDQRDKNFELSNRLIIKVITRVKRDIKSPGKWLSIISSSIRIISEHKESKKKRGPLKGKGRRDAVFQAYEIGVASNWNNAYEYVERFLEDDNVKDYAKKLFLANEYKHDDEVWLKFFNDFLVKQKLSQIYIKKQSNSLFSKLGSTAKEKVLGDLVSVIMSAYNSEDTISDSIDSILNQTWENLQLIIIDDNSTDNTLNICQQYEKLDGRVNVHSVTKNSGPYVCKNLALSLSKGKYITGQDADDWSHPQRIEKQVRFMEEHRGEVKVSVGNMLRITEDGEFSGFSRVGYSSKDGVQRLSSISAFFDKEFFDEKLGYWDSVRFGADSEMLSRVKANFPQNFAHQELFTMLCLEHGNSLTRDSLYGVSRNNGMSPVRREYRNSWKSWHGDIKLKTSYVPFPHSPRLFHAPSEMLSDVDVKLIIR